ncbi:MAG: phosphohydrolase [Deltaproteobacteria bacterium HGW-Deltaproteobacteria-10]|nr:MAG: phosphohydrolase [Deltaproteobacteria bacterium HGW-Deltaproteobacteria-10]
MKRKGFEAYFVGGCVRDFIRNVTPDDYDIVTSAHPEQVMAIFPRTVAVGAKFGVVAVIIESHPFEVATFRSDDAYIDGRRPSGVHFSTSREDVFRRDFTVNGLLMNPETEEIIDHVHGLEDIKKNIIRTIGDPDQRFNEDYLRMLRAIRFAASLNYEIDPATNDAITKHAAKIIKISAERLQEELSKIITRTGTRRGFALMAKTNLLREILPEVDRLQGVMQPPLFHPEGDVWQHTLMMLDLLPRKGKLANNRQLAWAALLHDVGKAVTRTEDEKGVHFYGHVRAGEEIAAAIMQRLRFSRSDQEVITELIRCHMMFMNVQKMRQGRLKRFLRMPNFDLHLELHSLDCQASHNMLDNYEFCQDQLNHLEKEDLHPPRLLTGDDLIALGFAPGKVMGEILRALEDMQLEGTIASRQEAENYVLGRWNR